MPVNNQLYLYVDPRPANPTPYSARPRPRTQAGTRLNLDVMETRQVPPLVPGRNPKPPVPRTRSIGTQTDPEPGLLRRWFGL